MGIIVSIAAVVVPMSATAVGVYFGFFSKIEPHTNETIPEVWPIQKFEPDVGPAPWFKIMPTSNIYPFRHNYTVKSGFMDYTLRKSIYIVEGVYNISGSKLVSSGFANEPGKPWLETLHGVNSYQELLALLIHRLPIGPVSSRLGSAPYQSLRDKYRVFLYDLEKSTPIKIKSFVASGVFFDEKFLKIENVSHLQVAANLVASRLLLAHSLHLLKQVIPEGFKPLAEALYVCCSNCSTLNGSCDPSVTKTSKTTLMKAYTQEDLKLYYDCDSTLVALRNKASFFCAIAETKDFYFGLAPNIYSLVQFGVMSKTHKLAKGAKVPCNVYVGARQALSTKDHFVSWLGIRDLELDLGIFGDVTLVDALHVKAGSDAQRILDIRLPHLSYEPGSFKTCQRKHRLGLNQISCNLCQELEKDEILFNRGPQSYQIVPESNVILILRCLSQPLFEQPEPFIKNWVTYAIRNQDEYEVSYVSFLPDSKRLFSEFCKTKSWAYYANGHCFTYGLKVNHRMPGIDQTDLPAMTLLNSNPMPHMFNLGLMNRRSDILGLDLGIGECTIDDWVALGLCNKPGTPWLKIPHGTSTIGEFLKLLWFHATYGPLTSYLHDAPYTFVGELWRDYVYPIVVDAHEVLPTLEGPGWKLDPNFIWVNDYSQIYLVSVALWFHLGKLNRPSVFSVPYFEGATCENTHSSFSCCTGDPDFVRNVTVLSPGFVQRASSYYNPKIFGILSPEMLVSSSLGVINSQNGAFIKGWAANIHAPMFPFLSTIKHDHWDERTPCVTTVTQPHTTRWPNHFTSWLGSIDWRLNATIGDGITYNTALLKKGSSIRPFKGLNRRDGKRQMFNWRDKCPQGHANFSSPCPTCVAINESDGLICHTKEWRDHLPWAPDWASKCAVVVFSKPGLFERQIEREAIQWAHMYIIDVDQLPEAHEYAKSVLPFYCIWKGRNDLLMWSDSQGWQPLTD